MEGRRTPSPSKFNLAYYLKSSLPQLFRLRGGGDTATLMVLCGRRAATSAACFRQLLASSRIFSHLLAPSRTFSHLLVVLCRTPSPPCLTCASPPPRLLPLTCAAPALRIPPQPLNHSNHTAPPPPHADEGRAKLEANILSSLYNSVLRCETAAVAGLSGPAKLEALCGKLSPTPRGP